MTNDSLQTTPAPENDKNTTKNLKRDLQFPRMNPRVKPRSKAFLKPIKNYVSAWSRCPERVEQQVSNTKMASRMP